MAKKNEFMSVKFDGTNHACDYSFLVGLIIIASNTVSTISFGLFSTSYRFGRWAL